MPSRWQNFHGMMTPGVHPGTQVWNYRQDTGEGNRDQRFFGTNPHMAGGQAPQTITPWGTSGQALYGAIRQGMEKNKKRSEKKVGATTPTTAATPTVWSAVQGSTMGAGKVSTLRPTPSSSLSGVQLPSMASSAVASTPTSYGSSATPLMNRIKSRIGSFKPAQVP